MATTYLFGYNNKRYTLAEMEQFDTWRKVHPEIRRRIVAMIDAAKVDGYDLGIGSGWRSSELQEQVFRSRYTAYPAPPGIKWEGMYWRKKPGVAPSAPPGSSYHESTDPLGYALAVDMLNIKPAIDWANINDSRFWLKDFANVNAEPWHYQPVEIPNARREYKPNVHTLNYWDNGSPKPPVTPPATTIPKGVETMGAPLVLRYGGTPTANWAGYFSFDGISRHGVKGMHHAAQLFALGAIDAKTGKPINNSNWSDVTHTSNAEELDEWLTPARD